MINETHVDIINILQKYKSNKSDRDAYLIALEFMKLYFIDKMLEHPKMLEQNTFEDIVKKATTLAKIYVDSKDD